MQSDQGSRTTTTRLLSALIAGLLLSGIGGVALSGGEAEVDDPTSALVAAADAPTIRAGQGFRPVAPSTSISAQATASQSSRAPIAPPRQPRTPGARIMQIGTIEIPKVGLVHPVFEGITLTVIDQGPGHWPGTAMPGQLGNSVFAGHRVTHSKPFRNIDRLGPGDQVIWTIGGIRSVYEFVRNEVVPPTALHIVEQTSDATATIFACHPPGSAKYRFVVHLRLVSAG